METITQSVFETLLNPGYLLFLFTGSFLGIVFGALPGLTAPMAIAVMLPLTYSMEPQTGLAFLLGVYSGVGYGGAIPAILVNIPGTPAAVMTAVDGYAMARRGQAGKAIGIATVASFAAGMFSIFCLMLTAPWLAKFALKFGPHEYFAIGVFGLSVTTNVIDKNWTKGLWAASLGVLISTVGLDPFTNDQRFSYGNVDLMSGIPFVPVMIGMFGLTRVFVHLNAKRRAIQPYEQNLTGMLPTLGDLRRVAKSTFQGSVTGTVIGALPGAGPAIAAFLSYDIEKKTSPALDKDGLSFGQGRMDGVAAPEAANNSITGGALIPLLTFGIPGSASVAIMMGALMMYNLIPGPLFFANHTDVVYSIYSSMILSNVFILIICLAGIKYFVAILRVPTALLMPVILILCVIGAYSFHNNPLHIVLMTAFGIVGYLFERASIPQLPLVLGLILGPTIEENLRHVLILDKGNFFMIFTHPISAVLLALAIGTFFFPMAHAIYRSLLLRGGKKR